MDTIRILVVSDNAEDIQLIQDLLAQSPYTNIRYNVEPTQKFQEALRALVSDAYDVYFVDYRVPETGITGLDLIRRAHAGGCTSPIILLTATFDEMVLWAAEEAGAADVLHKQHDLCPHPDCPMGLQLDTPRRVVARAIRYAIHNAKQLKAIEKQLDTVQQQLADVSRKLNRG